MKEDNSITKTKRTWHTPSHNVRKLRPREWTLCPWSQSTELSFSEAMPLLQKHPLSLERCEYVCHSCILFFTQNSTLSPRTLRYSSQWCKENILQGKSSCKRQQPPFAVLLWACGGCVSHSHCTYEAHSARRALGKRGSNTPSLAKIRI